MAQGNVIEPKPYLNPAYIPQIDSIKKVYEKGGFVLARESSMAMESEYEMPVVMPLTQGVTYAFVFIGEPTSKLYEVRMYDWDEKQVIYIKHQWGDVDGNIIAYEYTPKFSEAHMMKPVQVNKKIKGPLSGYVMVFKQTARKKT